MNSKTLFIYIYSDFHVVLHVINKILVNFPSSETVQIWYKLRIIAFNKKSKVIFVCDSLTADDSCLKELIVITPTFIIELTETAIDCN